MTVPRRLVVVGGGAAGFFAAIRAKTLAPALDVAILEAHARPLGKVKISGGGRCNVTHACFDPARLVQYYPRGQRELRGLFARFGPAETVRWFEAHGVPIKTEGDRRMFPVSDDSQTVIDCLVHEARRLGVAVHARHPARACRREKRRFVVEAADASWPADALLLASGSNPDGYAIAQGLGHGLVPPVPSLFTFNVSDDRLDGLAGVSLDRVVGRLRVGEARPVVQEGPLLITHWGLSGPLILRLSAWGARPLHEAGYRAQVILDLLPEQSQEALRAALLEQKRATPRRHVANEIPVDLPRRLWHALARHEGIDPERPWGDAPQTALNRLAEHLKRAQFEIRGKGVFKEEFVTAGGVPLSEVDFRTMESRLCPGLYFAGEILDVDALTGGFNFQNAWSTAWVAAESLIG